MLYIQPSLQWILIPALREKGPGCAVEYSHPSIPEVKERTEQYLHSSLSSWHVIGWTLLYTDVIGRDHAMTYGVSRWSVSTGDQFLTQTFSCGICGGQSVTRTGFPRIFRVSSINISSSVGIATDHGLDGPGSNPGGIEVFLSFRPVLGPTQPPVKWVPSLSRG